MRQQKQPPKPSFLDAATHDGMIRTGMKKLDDEDQGYPDEDPLQLVFPKQYSFLRKILPFGSCTLLSINRVCVLNSYKN